MQVRYFYRYVGKERLICCGHYTKKEILQLYQEGYRESQPRKLTAARNENKNGIPVHHGGRSKGS